MAARERIVAYQSIAASAAALVAFHGVLHEVIGPLLFPWAPATFGFALWHGLGIAVFVAGLLLWAGVLGLIDFPVVPVSIAVACAGIGAIAFMAVTHGQFHFFALCLAVAAAATALFHRRAMQERASFGFG